MTEPLPPAAPDGALRAYPDPATWADVTVPDARAWPNRAERHFTLVPTTCFNCEANCGLVAWIDKESGEIAVFQAYLPQQLSEAEIDKLVAEAIAATGASSVKDMGKVMGVLKPKLQGRADMGQVGGKIKARLGAG